MNVSREQRSAARWKPTSPHINVNIWAVGLVCPREADQVRWHHSAGARNLELMARGVELGTANGPSGVQSNNLVTDEVKSGFQARGDRVVVAVVAPVHEWGLNRRLSATDEGRRKCTHRCPNIIWVSLVCRVPSIVMDLEPHRPRTLSDRIPRHGTRSEPTHYPEANLGIPCRDISPYK